MHKCAGFLADRRLRHRTSSSLTGRFWGGIFPCNLHNILVEGPDSCSRRILCWLVHTPADCDRALHYKLMIKKKKKKKKKERELPTLQLGQLSPANVQFEMVQP